MSIYGALNMGMKALHASQTGIWVAGHNISNVNTPGYSRQQLVLTSSCGGSYDKYIGLGVNVKAIRRMHDGFVVRQINKGESLHQELKTKREGLELVESYFNELDNEGLTANLYDYFGAWQELASEPEDMALRQSVIHQGIDLAAGIKEKYSHLMNQQSDTDEEIVIAVGRINSITENIAELNAKIKEAELQSEASDFRDQRDVLMEELAGYIDFESHEMDDGSMTISAGKGQALVLGSTNYELEIQKNAENSFHSIYWNYSGKSIKMDDVIESGKIGGLISLRDEVLPERIDQLNELAIDLIDRVNGLHSTGYGLEGETGNLFFEAYADPELAASQIEVNEDIVDDPGLLAAAGTDSPGDNANALLIFDLASEQTMNGNTMTYYQYIDGISSELGLEVQQLTEREDTQADVMLFLRNKKDSVSGVSLDEEAANLLVYQNSYQAAMKFLQTVNEMCDRVFEMV